MTSKYQVTVPRKIAERYNIRPGDNIDWAEAGEVIRVIPQARQETASDPGTQLRLFDQATERQRKRAQSTPARIPRNRGWKREDLYERGRSR